jgi:hypothetical protein
MEGERRIMTILFCVVKGSTSVLTQLTLGKVLAARGEVEGALEAFDQAESETTTLSLRPIVWQARLAAAQALEAARAKLAVVRAMVEEIKGLITDETLRSAYLQNTLEKVGE